MNNELRVLVRKATIHYFEQRKMSPDKLPRTVEGFVLGWTKECPEAARATVMGFPLRWIVMRKLRQPRDWTLADHPPVLLYSSRP